MMFNIIPRFTDQDVETVNLDVSTSSDILTTDVIDTLATDVDSTNVTTSDATDVTFDDSKDNETVIEDFNPNNEDLIKLRNAFNKINNYSKINSDDEDEDSEDRIYIIIVNDRPYYYNNNLFSARKTMMKLAKKLITSNDLDEPDKYIMTNNDNEVKIVIPYDFLFVKYSHTIHTIKIDYVIPYKQ